MSRQTFVINGTEFSTVQGFFDAVTKVMTPTAEDGWIQNLDSFNDLLYRGNDKPQEGFILLWEKSEISRMRLGYSETIRFQQRKLLKAHPASRQSIQEMIEMAEQGQGPTLFDEIVELIKEHEDIELILN